MNEILTPDIQTNQPVVNKSNQNLFKYLFLFVLVLFFITFSFLIFVLIKQKNNSSLTETSQITPTPIVTAETEPTETPIESTISPSNSQTSSVKAYSKTVGNKINLILNINNQETVIDSVLKDENTTFDKINFSQSLRYLTYILQGQIGSSLKIYDTQKRAFIKSPSGYNNFGMQASNPVIITNDEKFLIYCSGGGYGGIDGAIILSLPENTTKFDFEKYLGSKLVSPSVSCSYYASDNTVSLSYYKDMEETKQAIAIYNLTIGSVVEN